MGSPTKKSWTRRAINHARNGKTRKRADRNNGSTPVSLPLNKPNANEKAQSAGHSGARS